jgi:putative ABC transport system permease protein
MFAGLVARARSLWQGIRHTRDVDADTREEMRLHVEMRAADLARSGLPPEEAARRARAEFGSAEYHAEQGRESRGLRWLDHLRFSWLDLKLGGRMLVKYPVLTIVGGFAMAFAIWVGAGTFEILRQFIYPAIPLPESGRIVVLQNWDAANSRIEPRVIRDFVFWREAVKSVDDVAAYRSVSRNLVVTEGTAEPALVAEMSAAAFRVVRVPPLMGRPFTDADEAADAPLVAVIGYDLWQLRFQGDPRVVGRTVQIGGKPATIVGVMPKAFAFPRTHQLWTPLKVDPASVEALRYTALRIVGRLAPNATIEQARNELTQLGRVAATDFPATHQHLRPQVITFGESLAAFDDDSSEILFYGNLFIMMLLTLVCANVALLMFARAATREAEIAVRSALGASRARIVMQLFAEALVLGGVAAAAGLTAASWGLRWALWMIRGEIVDAAGNYPFWVTGELSALTVGYAVLLTVIAAVIAGVIPGLKITRGLNDRLKSTAGGGVSFGGLWTAVIVIQIAVTMAFPLVTYFVRKDGQRYDASVLPFQVDRYLAVRLGMERTAPGDTSATAYQARFVAAVARLENRLLADSAVEGIAFAQLLPRQYHQNHQVEVDEGAVEPPDERGHVVGTVDVEPRFFDVLGVTMLSGRAFTSGDVSANARVAIVDKSFVDRVLGGKNPVGRRLRYGWSGRAGDTLWYEIVGMAPDLGIRSGWGPAGIYHPLQRSQQYPVQAAVRVHGAPADVAPRLRAMATEIEPTLQVTGLMPLRNVMDDELTFGEMWVRLATIASVMVLVLSLVGIYAVMSYSVSRRTREIGVRVALGATPWSVLRSVFGQPVRQIGLGILGGAGLLVLLLGEAPKTQLGVVAGGIGLVILGMVVASALACIVPTRRALAVEPMEALRTD